MLPDRVGGLGFELGFRLRVRVRVWVSIMKRPEENRRHKLRREEKITEQDRKRDKRRRHNISNTHTPLSTHQHHSPPSPLRPFPNFQHCLCQWFYPTKPVVHDFSLNVLSYKPLTPTRHFYEKMAKSNLVVAKSVKKNRLRHYQI